MASEVPTRLVSIGARQRKMIGGVNEEFLDEISARSRDNRPGSDGRIAYLRHSDTLHVASIDRLDRSLVDLRGIVDQITAKGTAPSGARCTHTNGLRGNLKSSMVKKL